MEEKIGKVTHYYDKLGVAAIEVQHGILHKGDKYTSLATRRMSSR